jgi:uncharacterized ferritin-like protein (DUF455 family)
VIAFFRACYDALAASEIAAKLAGVAAIDAAVLAGEADFALEPPPPELVAPSRPVLPRLVAPQDVPRRGVGTAEGRAALLHAIAHIEFNAIHLALDACYRFRTLPLEFHRDWIGVAAEEAKHFALLAAALGQRGYRYGSFEAHDGLWALAEKTRDDPLARMALVPRVMEARGLDVTPGIRARFATAGDTEAVAILDVILQDEIGHVAIGNRWYHRLCAERGVDPDRADLDLARAHRAPRPHRPLNRAARLAGGFTPDELDAIEAADAGVAR